MSICVDFPENERMLLDHGGGETWVLVGIRFVAAEIVAFLGIVAGCRMLKVVYNVSYR
jgi:hypothetical protein